MPDGNTRKQRLTRRDLIRAAAGASSGIVAGCAGGGGQETEVGEQETTVEEQATTVDRYFILPSVAAPGEFQFNAWGQQGFYYPIRFLWEWMAQLLEETAEFAPWLATDWSRDGNTITVDIREGIQWKSGEPVTAQDVVNHLRLSKLFAFQLWDFTESLEVVDDYSMSVEVTGVNTNVFEKSLLGAQPIYTHPSLHQEYIERERDETTEDARNQIRTDLAQYTLPPDEAKGKISNGPVSIGSVSQDQAIFERNPDYPIGWGDDPVSPEGTLNWKGFKLIFLGEDIGAPWDRAMISDRIDAHTGGSSSAGALNQMPEHWTIMRRISFAGSGITFSPDSLWGQDTEQSRNMRQGIAYLVDQSEIVKTMSAGVWDRPLINVPQYLTGLVTKLDDLWLSDALSDFTAYGTEEAGYAQEEKATQKFREAGLEKNSSGNWVNPESGNPLEVSLMFPAGWSGWAPGFRTLSEQLSDFGIRSQVSGQENTTYFDTVLGNNDFSIGYARFGNRDGPHPYHGLRRNLGSLSDVTSYYNNGLTELTVPWPPRNPSGDRTINVDDRLRELSRTTDSAREEELVLELTWIFNQWVPMVELTEGLRTHFISLDEWDYGVPLDDPKFRSEQPWAYLMRTGHMKTIE